MVRAAGSTTMEDEVAVALSAEPAGPHQLPYGEQERCAVEGRRIDGSGQCTVVAIRDRGRRGWVLYPHGVAGLGVLIADDAAHALAGHIGSRP
ncbi:MAG TPA: hypothetical protein VGL88_03050 [Pseudonocardiaceae bacterium]|jgi:hypothetical protein